MHEQILDLTASYQVRERKISMIGIYFSGTGNTRFCVDKFLEYYNKDTAGGSYAIEDKAALSRLKDNKDIVLGYPIYYSDLPMIMKNFIQENQSFFRGKNIFIIVTMGLFSGDGAGCAARLLRKYGANILGGLHVKMPDCIGDVKLLKKPLEENRKIVGKAEEKIRAAVEAALQGHYRKDGLGIISHAAGLFGQRLYFYNKTERLKDRLKIDREKCISCGKCSVLCPMKNIKMNDGRPVTCGNCTSCYRCISNCPKQAITLIGSKVLEQSAIEKYVDME